MDIKDKDYNYSVISHVYSVLYLYLYDVITWVFYNCLIVFTVLKILHVKNISCVEV